MRRIAILAVVLLALTLVAPAARAQVPAPDSHFDFELGADGVLASWAELVDYYRAVADASDRVTLRELGRTARDNPFVLLTITASANQGRIDALAETSRSLADPRGLTGADVERLAEEARAVVAVTLGLHSTEVAAAQMGPGLVHRLATSNDPETRRILDEVVFLLFPSFNPDGHEMVVEWVDETRGTPYAGSRLPDMYHQYVGHDNNRDGYMLTQREARYFAEVVYREWVPQMYLDVHQMGSYGPRLYVPPYDDPLNPNVDPMNWIEHQMVGGQMMVDLEREGITGVSTGTYYEGYWFPSFHMVTNHHNIAGMLTESASANMAEPLYIHRDQLRPQGKKGVTAGQFQNMPHPWEGGWWRVRDIVRQQHVSTYALLSTVAMQREKVVRNMTLKAQRTIQRGRTESPAAFVLPSGQHDPLTVDEFVHVLMANNVDVQRASEEIRQGERAFPAGSYVISTAQPNGVLVRSLMESTFYPDNALTRRADGSIVPPYDMANFVLAEHMGVTAVPLESPPEVTLELLEEPPVTEGRIVGDGDAGWLVDHALNASFKVLNRVLAAGGSAYWLQEPTPLGDRELAAGALWIPAAGLAAGTAAEIAADTHVDLHALGEAPEGPAWELSPLRLGMYRRYLGEQLDEGWSRFLFDTWGFPYERIEAAAIRDGALADLDVFLVPADGLERLQGRGAVAPPGEGEPEEYPEVFLPPEYTEGLDDEALEAIEEFVRGGGTLVLLDRASELAMEEMGVPVEDIVADVPREEFFSPGSNLWALFDTSHPLAYGMPAEALILNWGSPVYGLEPTPFNGRIAAPVRYRERDLLQSGWLIGEERIAERPAALDVEYGDGRILMIGFRAQHRAQNHGTFKVFFNALYYGGARETVLP